MNAISPDSEIWTNANFREGGVSSNACTPLMLSLYQHIWDQALPSYLRDLRLLDGGFQPSRIMYARLYWNLSAVKRCLAKLPGYCERRFDADLGIAPVYAGDGTCTPLRCGTVLRALPALLSIPLVCGRQEREARLLLDGGFAELERRYDSRADDPVAAMKSLIESGYRRVESIYFRTVFTVSMAKLDFLAAFPGADYAALVGSLAELKHLAPHRAASQMLQRGETDFTSLIERYKHHSRRTLDLRAPRWDEDRTFVESLLSEAGWMPAPEGKPADPSAEAEASLPKRLRRRFRSKLARLRRLLWLREELRDLSGRIYYLLRRQALAIARDQGLGDDVFFMTFPELLASDRSRIARHRATYEQYLDYAAPNEIGPAGAPPQRSLVRTSSGGAASLLSGVGVSPGKVDGPARIVRSLEEAARVAERCILVAPYVDPNWTPILGRLAGVVAETGGLLSHAAVLCREYRIPAVLGVAAATRAIRDGQAVKLDGIRGLVELCPASSAAG